MRREIVDFMPQIGLRDNKLKHLKKYTYAMRLTAYLIWQK